MTGFLKNINKDWTIFLDRDGVINNRPIGDYVRKWEDFEFLPGVVEGFAVFNKIFKKIIVVTNQQGIGKGLMTIEDLEAVHSKMITEIQNSGGRIDAVYYCPELARKPLSGRKPSTFMAQKALAEFPDIDFEKSLMLGDMVTDMQFGKNAGMKTIYINTNQQSVDTDLYDETYSSLNEFAKLLSQTIESSI